MIEGDPTKDLFTVYRMVFLREHGAQTEIINSEVVSDHCPNCGAPLTIDSIDKCEYCQASLKHNPKDWVLMSTKLWMKLNSTDRRMYDLLKQPFQRAFQAFKIVKFMEALPARSCSSNSFGH